MFYKNYNYSGITDYSCRYCSNKGNIISTNYDEKLFAPCKCKDMKIYTHAQCFINYIETSCTEQAYSICPLCKSAYTTCFNFELDTGYAKTIYNLSFFFEIIKCITLVLCILFASIVTTVLINNYVYEYLNFLESLLCTSYIVAILFAIFVIFSIIVNFIAVIRVLVVMKYYRKDKFQEYHVLNYETYLIVFRDRFNSSTCKIMLVTILCAIFIPFSFGSVMMFAYLRDKRHQLKNRYYATMYCANINTNINTYVI